MHASARRSRSRIVPAIIAGIVLVGIVFVIAKRSSLHSFGELELRGGPVVITTPGAPAVLALTSSWETYQRTSSRSIIRSPFAILHWDVWPFNPNDLSRKWVTRVASIKKDAQLDPEAGVLGAGDGVAWVLADGVMGIALDDGHVIGDADSIEARNPALKGLMPSARKQLYFDNGLVIISGDGKRWRINNQTLAATEDTTTTAIKTSLVGVPQSRATTPTTFLPLRLRTQYQDFKSRSYVVGDTWFGMMHPTEVERQRSDPHGQNYAEGLRYRLWRSALKDTLDRMRDPTRVPWDFEPLPDSPEFLKGGLLTVAGPDGRDGVVGIANPTRFLILHQNRIDAAAEQTLTCITLDGKVCWNAPLEVTIATGFAMLSAGGPANWGIVVIGEQRSAKATNSSTETSAPILLHVAVRDGKVARMSLADIDLAKLSSEHRAYRSR